jgi:phosphatidylserine/phosphatidylglycerophosphate/cardiolipin synthase-like enzyme
MKTWIKISALMAFAVLVMLSSCYVTVHFKPIPYRLAVGDLYAIFSNDFPFEISKQTPDTSTVIPPARSGCSVRLLPAGQKNFLIKDDLLGKARKSIKVQTYILYSKHGSYKDPVAIRMADILKKKNSEGMRVELIADCYTKSATKDQMFYARIMRDGVDLLGYEPLYFSASENPNLIIDGNDINMRFHEKYLIVDDYVAVTGGTNIAQEYAQSELDPRFMWRDQDIVLYGPVVRDMARAFDENYVYFAKKRENRPDLINPQFYREQLKKAKPALPGIGAEGYADNPSLKLPDLTDENITVRFIRHRPRLKETYVHQAYIHLFNTAKKRILIENSYILLDKSQSKAITDAVKRGVEVVVVTNCRDTSDVFEMAPLTRYSYLHLMEAGVKIYEWQGIIPGKGSLHAKYAVIDDDVSVIGSFNLDPRSTFLNSEDVVIIRSGKVANQLRNYTETIDLSQSKLITMEQAKKWHAPTPDKIWTALAMIFKDWW